MAGPRRLTPGGTVSERPEAPVTQGGDMYDNGINLVGNLTADPEFKVTSGGVAVARFRLACSRRIFDRTANEWRDGEPSFFAVTAWRQLAQNIHTSLRKGDRAVVVGRMRQSTFENSNNERRTYWEVEADAVGADLSWSCAQVQRTRRPVADSQDTAGASDSFSNAHAPLSDAGAGDELDDEMSYLTDDDGSSELAGTVLAEPASV
jgi:single-strand DNA-binding protein